MSWTVYARSKRSEDNIMLSRVYKTLYACGDTWWRRVLTRFGNMLPSLTSRSPSLSYNDIAE